MNRTVRTTTAVVAAVVALAAGAGSGVAGHAVARELTSADAGTASPAGDGSGGVLGAANLLATGDFAAIGWTEVEVDTRGVGEPQFPYACQRSTLSATGESVGTVSGTWTRDGEYAAAETVAEAATPPQADRLFAVLVRWHEHCGTGAGPRGDAEPVGTVRTDAGTARTWRVSGPHRPTAFEVVVHAGDRVALLEVYDAPPALDETGLPDLARDALDRLG